MRKCFSLLFLLLISNVFSQENDYIIEAKFDIYNRLIDVTQSISFTNKTPNNLDYIILNDWSHSYSNPSSPLGKRLSEDFTFYNIGVLNDQPKCCWFSTSCCNSS